MIIGVLKEIKPNEYRVAATPATVSELVRRGHTVLVQADAGKGSGYTDAEYAAAGATILATAKEVYEGSDLFYKVKEMFPEEWQYMNEKKIVFTYIHSNAHPEETDAILASKVTAIAYEDVTDDQGGFPLLKPMSILAGKGGFLAALHHMQSVFGGNGTLLASVTGIPAVISFSAINSAAGLPFNAFLATAIMASRFSSSFAFWPSKFSAFNSRPRRIRSIALASWVAVSSSTVMPSALRAS